MPRASSALRRADHYKPSLGQRLKQSQQDRERNRNHEPRPRPAVATHIVESVQIDVGVEGIPLAIITGRNLSNTQTTDCFTVLEGTMNVQDVRNVWNWWVNPGTTCCCQDPWNHWVINPTAAAYAHTDTWVQWQTIDGQTGYVSPRGEIHAPTARQRIEVTESEEQKKLRAEQKARWAAEEKERLQKYEEEQKKLREATERAMKLLKSCLTPDQRTSLERNNFFYVTAKSGRRYRIDQGTHGNVKVVDREGRIIERLCIQPNEVPVGDAMLAQKLLIETAEDVFRAHANITLNDGRILYGRTDLLDADKLADVIPIRRAA